MRVIIAGSRKVDSVKMVDRVMSMQPFAVTEVVSGHARGVDRCGEAWAKARDIPVTTFAPKYAVHGRVAPLVRNSDMADYADALVAIWDGMSSGTVHMRAEMTRRNKPVFVILKTDPLFTWDAP